MKKALIVILILAVAGGLFAQVNFSGWAEAGLSIPIEDGDTTFHASKNGGDPFYWEVAGGYTTESGKAGVDFGFGSGNADLVGGWEAKLWYKPLDILTLYAGKGNSGGVGTPGDLDASNGVHDPVGLALKLVPISGLTVGAAVAPSGAGIEKAAYSFGVGYTMADVFSAAANLKYNGTDETTNAAAGVGLLLLNSVGISKIAVDLSAENVTNLDTAGKVTLGPRINFGFGDLGGHLRGRVYLPMKDADTFNADIGAQVSYPVSGVTASLGVVYELNGAVAASKGSAFDGNYWEGRPNTAAADSDSSWLSINPKISFGLGGGDIDIGYGLHTNVGGNSYMKHVIFTNFGIGF
jgi:hypothetical protein